ncbi:acyl-CoA carboxylase subunit beta [Haloechinothrix sp. LS1_15]|uniref:acyl-CoA carboxylase subunit beta n=1 Tax=Haloechinothrix sp. LS1_15 TaxID=2652248 RepID=UPI00294582D0|nr:acyl-CoA carboxylase subunit beta [Haloechinothrix sp. LS1_15]MDV6012200.1 acyl-CoA carboxylase subunit beta [Haloechinothrix sp. LS1_15]
MSTGSAHAAVNPDPVDPPDPPEDTGTDLRARTEQRRRIQHDIESGFDSRSSQRQREKGKLTVYQRLERLLDRDSFVEIESLRRHRSSEFGMAEARPYTDGVVAGWGTIDGRTVFVYGQDFRIFGGSLGEAHAEKIHKVMDLAESAGAPLIGLNDGAGARIQEGVVALAGYGGIFQRIARLSGVIPQISVMLGPCAGGAVYAPAMTDFVFMVGGISQMYVTGPDVISAVTGESVTHEELGGAEVHATRSGIAGAVYDNEDDCLSDVRYLISLLPSNNRELPPETHTDDPPDRGNDALLNLVPAHANRAFDMHEIIHEIVDDGVAFEIHDQWARNVICAFGRIAGQVVGFVANQPAVLAGVLDISASEKAARFVQMCDAFNVPLVTLVDVPGFLPGVQQEHAGLIRHGAKLLYAYCTATVPRVQVIVRKAYGGAYIVLDSRSVGADLSFAWPGNEVAVMGSEAAVNIIFRHEVAAAEDPEAVRERRIKEYRERLMHPYYAAEHGLVDDVIDPARTRETLARSLAMLRAKHAPMPARKHGNPAL